MKRIARIILLTFLMTIFCSINAFAAESPRLMLQKISTEPETINPGEKFQLKLSVKNTSKADVKNAVVKLVSLEGKDTLGDFSPVGSSSEIYLGSISKNSTKAASINLIANTTVKSGAYNMVISLSYNDIRNRPFSNKQVVGIIVKNKPILKVTALDYPSTLDKKGSAPLTVSVINAGKGTLDGVMITLDNLPGAEKTRYIGLLEPGDSDDFETELEVDEDIKGNIQISYMDEFNVESKLSQEVSIKVNAGTVSSNKDSDGGFFSSVGKFFKKLFGLGD